MKKLMTAIAIPLLLFPGILLAKAPETEKADIPALYIKENFPNFYEIVTQNSAKSNANKKNCINGNICLSGLGNFDLKYYEREGADLPGSLLGVGVRPLFGIQNSQFLGSISNINLFVDAAVNHWLSAHLDIVYINASHQSVTYSLGEYDWGSANRSAAALKLNEGYILLADPAKWPLYIKIGRFMADFGDYDPFPMTKSLTQLISEDRTGGVILGFVLENGLYGSASWTTAQQSAESLNFYGIIPAGDNTHRNFGGKLGYRNTIKDALVNFNISYLNDLRDATYILEGLFGVNNASDSINNVNTIVSSGQTFLVRRSDGIAIHADVEYGRFGLTADYVTALRKMNPNNSNSRINAWGVNGSVDFDVMQFPTRFEIGYQGSDNAEIVETIITAGALPPPFLTLSPFGPLTFGAILPEHRFITSVEIQVLPQASIALQWVTDWDFSADKGGQAGESSNMAVARVSFEI